METLPSGLPKQVGDQENLARFLTSSSDFNRLGAKPKAFLPDNGETSVFRQDPEPLTELWKTSEAFKVHKIYGVAIVKTQVVRAIELEVTAVEPPDRHANIVNWPALRADSEIGYAAQKQKAARLAERSDLILK